MSENFPDALRSHREANPGLYVPVENITVAEANKLTPAEGYLCFYCDLLGFSNDMMESGSDSLPDFYGATLVTAAQHPSINVYLFSDTCVAFAPSSEGSNFLNFVSLIFSRWLSDAMVPQAFVGYGSFVERKPDLGLHPSNFLGTQITGTALIDAANVKKSKPLGSRVLLTQLAFDNLSKDQSTHIVLDEKGYLELLPNRPPQFDLLDCLYYLQYLGTLDPDSHVFDHYTWSYASRVRRSGGYISDIARSLSEPYFRDGGIDKIMQAVDLIVDAYEDIPVEN